MNIIRYDKIEAYRAIGPVSAEADLKQMGCRIVRAESADKGEFYIMELDRLPDPMPDYIELEPQHRFYKGREPDL